MTSDNTRDRQKPHAIVRNGTDIMQIFKSACLAEEGMVDLGCYTDRVPTPEDQFTVNPVRLIDGKFCVILEHAI